MAFSLQKITIGSKEYPSGRRQSKFPTLRGGTADSTLKFMMKLFDKVKKNLSTLDIGLKTTTLCLLEMCSYNQSMCSKSKLWKIERT